MARYLWITHLAKLHPIQYSKTFQICFGLNKGSKINLFLEIATIESIVRLNLKGFDRIIWFGKIAVEPNLGYGGKTEEEMFFNLF